MKDKERIFVYGLLSLTAVLLLSLWFDWWPLLRGGFGWRWFYIPFQWYWLPHLWPGLVALAVYGMGLIGLRRAWMGWYGAWCVLGATVVPTALLRYLGDPLTLLFTRTVSGLTTGGFTIANEIEQLPLLVRAWPTLMPTYEATSIHMTLSPPGWPTLYYGVQQLLAQLPWLSDRLGMVLRPYQCHDIPLMVLSNAEIGAAWLGILSPLWAGFTVVPLYGLGKMVLGERGARQAVAWWALVPSLALFLGTLNTPYPLAATTMLWLFWAGLERGTGWRAYLLVGGAGGITAVTLLFNFAFVPLLLLVGLVTLLLWWPLREARGWGWPLRMGVVFGGGLLLVFGSYTVYAGHTPLDILLISSRQHLSLNRPYLPWLFLHSWEFVLFVGVPLFGLMGLGWWRDRGKPVWRLTMALGLTLLLFVLSGTARGETGRVWFFLMPLVLLGAASVWQRLPRYQQSLLVGAQVCWLLVLLITLRTVGTNLTDPPAYEKIAFADSGAPFLPVSVSFEDGLSLVGFRSDYDRGALVVDLQWQLAEATAVPYFFSAVLVGPEGQVLPAVDWQPFAYQYPVTCWDQVPADTPVVDRVRLPLSEAVMVGEWWLSLSVFDLSPDGTPIRLSVIAADGSEQDDQVGLGPLPVINENE